MKVSFSRRLKVCLSWQWRLSVVVKDVKSMGELLWDLTIQTVGSILGFLILPLWPIILIWRYTGSVLWYAITLSEDSIEQLEKAKSYEGRESLNTVINSL